MIQIDNLYVRFKKKVILNDISFGLAKGKTLGMIGNNGAGKTTMIKVLSTLLISERGSASIGNFDLFLQQKEIRQMINFCFGGDRGLYSHLSGEENLKLFCSLYGSSYRSSKQKTKELISLVGLDGSEKKQVVFYSKGMKQRLHIARSLVNDPKILFLDEPTLGLDIDGNKALIELVLNLKTIGKTIIYTSHYMKDLETVGDRFAFLKAGNLVSILSKDGIKDFFDLKKVIKLELINPIEKTIENSEKKQILNKFQNKLPKEVIKLEIKRKQVVLYLKNDDDLAPILKPFFPYKIKEITTQKPSLEEIYQEIYN